MHYLIELILHTDDALLAIVSDNVNKAYLLLFLLILLETGLILFPFLPGDGLLFSAGVVAASTGMDIRFLIILLITAAILGNLINYKVGRVLGAGLKRSNNRFLHRHIYKHMTEVEAFYAKYGGGAVILGRFFPVIRTYIPFLAGVVKMHRGIFIRNTILGAVTWIAFFLLTGFLVGEIEWVKRNYGLIFLILVTVSVIPFFYSMARKFFSKNKY